MSAPDAAAPAAPRRASTEREAIAPAEAPAYRDPTAHVYPDEKTAANFGADSASSADNHAKDPAATHYGDAANSSEKLGSVEAGKPEGDEEKPGFLKSFYRRHRVACKIGFQFFVWAVSTVYAFLCCALCALCDRALLISTAGSSTASSATAVSTAPTRTAGSSPRSSTSPFACASSSTGSRPRSS